MKNSQLYLNEQFFKIHLPEMDTEHRFLQFVNHFLRVSKRR